MARTKAEIAAHMEAVKRFRRPMTAEEKALIANCSEKKREENFERQGIGYEQDH